MERKRANERASERTRERANTEPEPTTPGQLGYMPGWSGVLKAYSLLGSLDRIVRSRMHVQLRYQKYKRFRKKTPSGRMPEGASPDLIIYSLTSGGKSGMADRLILFALPL